MLYIVTYKQEDEIIEDEYQAADIPELLSLVILRNRSLISVHRASLNRIITRHFINCSDNDYKSTVSDFLSTLPNDIATKQSIAFGKLSNLIKSLPEILLKPYYDKIIS